MKLFSNLSKEDQEKAINFALKRVLEDILQDEFTIHNSFENPKDEKHLQKVLKKARECSSEQEGANLLLDDEFVRNVLVDCAVELAKSAYFHDDDEFVIMKADLYEGKGSVHFSHDDLEEGEDDSSEGDDYDDASSAAPKEPQKSKKLLN